MSLKSPKTLFSPKSLFLWSVLIVVAFGLFELLMVKERNSCHMTYMFQVPQFIVSHGHTFWNCSSFLTLSDPQLIPMKNRISLKYPNYNLYGYGEGYDQGFLFLNHNISSFFNRYYAQNLRWGSLSGLKRITDRPPVLRDGHFAGVPVVFVPGNGGSHKQVRSLGSVAQRMSDRYQTPFHLNYFTIDYNEVFVNKRQSTINLV